MCCVCSVFDVCVVCCVDVVVLCIVAARAASAGL